MADIRVTADELARFTVDLFRALGMAPPDAAAAADVLVWANLRGVDTHGVMRLASYLDLVRDGVLQPAAQPTMRPLLDATFVVDANRCAGPVAMAAALARASEIAPRLGVGLGLISNTAHTGAVGYYAQKLAERGLAAIVIVTGPPLMAYHGARVPALGTSPIAIAIPTEHGEPLLLDMATSLVSFGRIRQAASTGERIPEGAAIDAGGRPTTEGAKAATLLPLGGAKGSGLSLMFECLTGIMAATPILTALAGLTAAPPAAQNALLIAIDIGNFRPLSDFRHEVAALQDWIKSLPRQDGVEELLLPGERGGREMARRRRDGVPLPARLWDELAAIAARLGITGLAPTS